MYPLKFLLKYLINMFNEFLNGIIVKKKSTLLLKAQESWMATECACLTNINLVISSQA